VVTKTGSTDPVFSQPPQANQKFFDPAAMSDPLDVAGQNALDLVQRAAGTSKESTKRAISIVNELTLKLRSANNRIHELEVKLAHSQERAERAERWFRTISDELQRQFLELPDNPPEQAQRNYIRMASSRAERNENRFEGFERGNSE